jgi:hypothetical protein
VVKPPVGRVGLEPPHRWCAHGAPRPPGLWVEDEERKVDWRRKKATEAPYALLLASPLVAVKMMLWNKVSPTSLPRRRSFRHQRRANEGWFCQICRFSSYLSSWCVHQEMQLVVLCWGSFNLFLRFVLRQIPVPSTRWFGDEGLQVCVVWDVVPADVLSTIARSRCKQQVVFAVFKAMYGDDVCRCSFPLLPFQCFFQTSVDGELWKEEDDQSIFQCNFIFFTSLCVKLSFPCTVDCFL